MSNDLDIHPASDAERAELFRNVFDVWAMRETVEEHVQARLNSAQHRRATWFVGCVDGRVVVSLGRFPLQFRYHGEIVPGIAIGAVHCLEEFRGRGFAPMLMREVERISAEDGAAISLLYSDIKPDYYARMGYQQGPAWEVDAELAKLPVRRLSLRERTSVCEAKGETARGVKGDVAFRACQTAEDAKVVRELYEHFHADLPLAVHRGDDYWQYLRLKTPRDKTFLLESASGEPAGYFRVGIKGDAMLLRDCALVENSSDAILSLFSSIIEAARQHGVQQLHGWIPGNDDALSILSPQLRSMEITMVKPLRDDIAFNDADLQAADWFHEIDHV